MSLRANWCFTLNNYDDEIFASIRAYLSEHARFAIVGREVGATGTRHLQGYFELRVRSRLASLKDTVFQAAHLEPRRGTASQARNYCRKEDPEPFIHGVISSDARPGSVSRDDLYREFCRCMSTPGLGLGGFADKHPGVYGFSGHTLLRNYAQSLSPASRPTISVTWFHGAPGTGKSRRAHDELPNAYIKDPRTKWWTGYLGEPDVIIDDLGPNGIDINHLLRWFDRYKCTVETKGGVVALLAVKFIVTSNFTPSEVYWNHLLSCEHVQLPALSRRITCIEF